MNIAHFNNFILILNSKLYYHLNFQPHVKDTILGCGYGSYKEWLRGMVSPDVEADHIAVIGLRILLNVNKYYNLLHCNIIIYSTIKCNKTLTINITLF